ncbi:hypothetical protein BV22DRAFT_1042330, partial [Leucogyrophana mollusca]
MSAWWRWGLKLTLLVDLAECYMGHSVKGSMGWLHAPLDDAFLGCGCAWTPPINLVPCRHLFTPRLLAVIILHAIRSNAPLNTSSTIPHPPPALSGCDKLSPPPDCPPTLRHPLLPL